ncbi:hypothetical protein [Rhodobacter capsulatus]|jgi:hypothetical protein|uniref:Uncharacterized protein n=1 Tax=Rhodobacter capsulatus (strain ATCC BAA-309 / NBRC 16581 / SB1003) TaxID=272942 RepID=D5ASH6_RHOCB|nr:hypothetical protein [Rhodobacter capsulatus]ADE85067.1 conserved hypothetical protein [Rhodobacter capsulatus SB 1003]ETD02179.1 hypothetical protein U714_07790 [Rhodobacter capsulatus DE442]ETD77869.1 hypothetical protein U717_07965 [Rhodobacter capsulatus R121]ETE54212.1 hypothetical protein U715_07965 [Rhodobacter capsulatus Y262]MDS0926719.1 hypothetical protein [Rhodobacter capsulatus]
MTFIAFLNELSFPSGAVDAEAAEAAVVGLAKTLQSLRQIQSSAALHSSVPLASIPLGDDRWLGTVMAKGRSRDEWRFLRSFENRAPFRVNLGEAFGLEAEYRYGDVLAEGLGLGHIVGTLGVSFANEPWLAPTVPLRRISFDEHGGFEERVVHVHHAATPDHVKGHDEWLRRIPSEQVRDGDELWARRAEIFPHLLFLPRTEAHLRAFKAGEPRLSSARQALMDLEIAAAHWNTKDAAMPTFLTKTTPEKEQRSKLFYFIDLSGVERCFDWHSRYTPGAGRVHFWCDRSSGRLTIAHVGEKVPN